MNSTELQSLLQLKNSLLEKARSLRELSDQAFHIEFQIRMMAGIVFNLGKGETEQKEAPSNIIKFPGPMVRPLSNRQNKVSQPGLSSDFLRFPFLVPISARPGEQLPSSLPDFRPHLQRDGLILLSWDRRLTESGERFTAYWVTSAGPCRYYASLSLGLINFASAVPERKSYAAENGIEFYGQQSPSYIVHVAPELMLSRQGPVDKRPEHIGLLKEFGVQSDFTYQFLLTKERKNRRGNAKDIKKAEKHGA
ncbi:MAG: hypothetical protein LBF78_16090 [Treponema sp.]|jgi:hypothetical protein|nr:hypothetical protein [Treponema sp.]